MGGITLDNLDQVGDEISPPLIGCLDITPGGNHRFIVRLDPVVTASGKPQAKQGKQHPINNTFHCISS